MQKQKYFSRYDLIINRLSNGKQATFEEIKDYIENQADFSDFNASYSKRTFDRDKIEIADLFGTIIEYDYSRKVYSIKEQGQDNRKTRLLEAFNMYNFLKTSDNLANHVIFEKRKPLGTEHFYGLLHAIQNHFIVKFIHTKYWEDDVTVRTVEPYALKECAYRWYLLAKDQKDNHIKSFGLDRISELEITKIKFSYPKNYYPNEEYRNYFGIINDGEGEPEEVVLSFDAFKGKYILSFPLHESQEVLLNNENEIRIKLKIYITPDFLKEILSYGKDIKIISPESLKTAVCEILKKALKNNK